MVTEGRGQAWWVRPVAWRPRPTSDSDGGTARAHPGAVDWLRQGLRLSRRATRWAVALALASVVAVAGPGYATGALASSVRQDPPDVIGLAVAEATAAL